MTSHQRVRDYSHEKSDNWEGVMQLKSTEVGINNTVYEWIKWHLGGPSGQSPILPIVGGVMKILEYDQVDPLSVLQINLLALDFALTPEHAAHIRHSDPRPFPFFAIYASTFPFVFQEFLSSGLCLYSPAEGWYAGYSFE